MKPKLTIEHTTHGFVTIRHDGHLWEIFPHDVPGVLALTHRTPSGKWEKDLLSVAELERKLVDLIVSQLKLSDLWNGQTRLF